MKATREMLKHGAVWVDCTVATASIDDLRLRCASLCFAKWPDKHEWRRYPNPVKMGTIASVQSVIVPEEWFDSVMAYGAATLGRPAPPKRIIL